MTSWVITECKLYKLWFITYEGLHSIVTTIKIFYFFVEIGKVEMYLKKR